ncbi:transposase [Heliorestis acidaminivorans]|uniref:Transposase n=1 Tax=Heliorestis acidaminivorans TaxID=553427 RepID=A0A6I0F3A4_9FIRM|nr:transposase [Heliorestis acidaminivorans]KAB2951640.1 transposase [Heliorestis acidaminivorans]
MPRRARVKSSTGIYHAMLRGINRQIIFEDNEDYEKILQIIQVCKEKSGFELYGYCLMSNHIHLLIKEAQEDLGLIFKRIGSRYVKWYNQKYERTGHLFQDRFKSEVVETENYFLTVLRYIHQNPLKAGLVEDIANYRWSSYNEYISKENLCDTNLALSLFSNESPKALALFTEHNKTENKDKCLENEEQHKVTDSEAEKIILNTSGVRNLNLIQKLDKDKRNKIIRESKKRGLSIRQIQRLTGISFGVIRNI